MVVANNRQLFPANQLLVATSNTGKIKEISLALSTCGKQLLFLNDLDIKPSDVAETGETFAENAEIKAKFYCQIAQLPTIADDSGLSVLELDGFPGVQSARWHSGSDVSRMTALLALMEKQGLTDPAQRRAYFSCVVSLCLPNLEESFKFEGELWGTLAYQPAGSEGFGYDPIFIPDGYKTTMAQLGLAIKQQISARSQALAALAAWLQHH